MDELPLRPDGLQLDEDRRYQERFWTAERVAWAVFCLILVAALAGLTGGGGPMASASRQVGEAKVDYPAIARWTTPATLTIGFAKAGTVDVRFGPRFLRAFEVSSITPQPSSSATGPAGLRLSFEVDGDDAAPAALQIKPLSAGLATYDIAVGGTGPVTLSTFVMP